MIPYCQYCQGAQPYHYKLRRREMVCVCDFCGEDIEVWPLDDKVNHRLLYCETYFDRVKLVRRCNQFVREKGWLGAI